MKIVVDAMGGDFAPEEIVKGSIEAALKDEIPLILVGDKEKILKVDANLPALSSLIEIYHTPQAITMEDKPSISLKKKKNASIIIGARLVKEGKGDAIVSAGNTGAVVGAALLELGEIKGIERPAIATFWPTIGENITMLIDSGAVKDCKTKHLLQFALMGNLVAKYVFNIQNPRVGLLNIGEESTKGNALTLETYPILANNKNINFIGNVEGGELPGGKVDVVVCDGFTGNVVLKTGEGIANFINTLFEREFLNYWNNNIPEGIKKIIAKIKKTLDYAEHGGGLLLGVNGICIITHGRSNARGIRNSIKMAYKFAKSNIIQKLKENLTQNEQN